jgi:DNA-binding SARP family transcriptional activator
LGTLNVSLLGSVRISYDDYPVDAKMTRSIQRLLAYLILFRNRTHQREVLADVLWGEKDHAHSRDSLNTALWKLRKTIEAFGISRDTYLLCSRPDEIGFNQHSPLWLDVEEFQESTDQILESQSPEILEVHLSDLENAIELYRGDLLEGFYDDWVLREREYWRERYTATLICLMGIYRRRSEFERGLACGQKILTLDPLREEIHRSMIQLYMDAGQRSLAVRQYELCRETLAHELRIEPMEETQQLYQQIIADNPTAFHQVQPDSAAELQQALQQLNHARLTFELACDQLKQSMDLVDSTIRNQSKRSADKNN